MTVYYKKLNSPCGPIHVYANENALLGLYFAKPRHQKIKCLSTSAKKAGSKVIAALEKQLSEYFHGKRKVFSLPLHIEGTPFQKSAWEVLCKIPYAKTMSYSEQAKSLGRAKAARAVGSANGKNLFPIVIPCHRVVAADGSLGGYAGGLRIKKLLLNLESA